MGKQGGRKEEYRVVRLEVGFWGEMSCFGFCFSWKEVGQWREGSTYKLLIG